jgi:hypothetical protein
MPRCLIGYFGLARLIAATAPAIETNFIAPLREAGFEILRAGHFNCPPVLDNPRSGEHGPAPESDPARALVLDAWEQEPQTDAAISGALAIAQRYPDAFGDEHRSLRNLCHQLRSLDRLWLLLAAFRPAPDDVVLLLRPDLLYLDRLDVSRDLGVLRGGHAARRAHLRHALPADRGGLPRQRHAACREFPGVHCRPASAARRADRAAGGEAAGQRGYRGE